MRFALADALLSDEIAKLDPAQLPRAAPLHAPLLDPADYEPKTGRFYSKDELKKLDEDHARDEAVIIMYRLGDWTVRTDPQNSRALLMAPEGSQAETQGFQALIPAFASRLQKGSSLKFDRQVLRGVVAFSYFSLAHAPVAPEMATAPR